MNETEMNEFIKRITASIIKLDGSLVVFLDEDVSALIGYPLDDFLFRIDCLKNTISERFKFRATKEEYQQILSARRNNLINITMNHRINDLAAFEEQYSGDPTVHGEIIKERDLIEKERVEQLAKSNEEVLHLITSKKEMPFLFTEIGLAMLCPFIRNKEAKAKLEFLIDFLYSDKLQVIKELTKMNDNYAFQNEIKKNMDYILNVLASHQNEIKRLSALKESFKPKGKIGLIAGNDEKVKIRDLIEESRSSS